MTLYEIEHAVAQAFGFRRNIIIPNISWGMGLHECDLLVLTKSNFAYEIEIKRSRQDLVKDKTKKHGHESPMIKKVYFAIPEKMEKYIDLIPEKYGVFICKKIERPSGKFFVLATLKREAVTNKNHIKWKDSDRMNLLRLSYFRIWSLKKKIIDLSNHYS